MGYLPLPLRAQSADVDETPRAAETPPAMVLRLSLEKAGVIARAPADAAGIVVAADTTVVLEGQNIGKPADAADAVRILKWLRGRAHHVYTGLTLMPVPSLTRPSLSTPPANGPGVLPRADDLAAPERRPAGSAEGVKSKTWSALCHTLVHMREYSDDEIRDYVASASPFDKAGAYAIQDEDFHPVIGIEGCYLNVMGLPLCEVIRGLRALGVELDAREPVAHDCLLDFGRPCFTVESSGNHSHV